jgi:hypothetical protein
MGDRKVTDVTVALGYNLGDPTQIDSTFLSRDQFLSTCYFFQRNLNPGR